MNITFNLDPTKNLYINEQDEYTLTKKKSQIEIKPDNVNKKTYIFDRDKIWIDEFSAKYIKGFNKITEIRPNKIIIAPHHCRLKYDNFGDRDFNVIAITVQSEDKKYFVHVQAPALLKVLDLKRHLISKFIENGYLKTTVILDYITLIHGSEHLYENFTLRYYKINDKTKTLIFKVYDNKQQSLRDFPTTVDFSLFHTRLTNLSDLICYIEMKVVETNIKGVGTGFLISPDKILTNNHVVSDKPFNQISISFCLDSLKPITFKRDETSCKTLSNSRNSNTNMNDKSDYLDLAIITIPKENFIKLESIKKWKSIQKLACEFFSEDNIQKAVYNDLANIIQFPGIEDKRIVFQRNEFIKISENTYHYSTQTEKGSSGSPILSNMGKFLGYHYGECNIPEKKMREVTSYYANQPIKRYKDRSNPTITWVINKHAVSLESSTESDKKQSTFKEFIENYEGPLSEEDETPFFYNVEFIETYNKHKHCNCGIPANLISEIQDIKEILEKNKEYLKGLKQSHTVKKRLAIGGSVIISLIALAAIGWGLRNRKKL